MQRTSQGFTLIEMMIIVVIVAILAAVALPSYLDYVRKSRRADGMNALLQIQTLEEKWRASNTTYSNVFADIGATNTSAEGYYAITIASNTATGYTLTASGQGDQANDDEDGVSCSSLILTINAANPRGLKGRVSAPTDDTCWN